MSIDSGSQSAETGGTIEPKGDESRPETIRRVIVNSEAVETLSNSSKFVKHYNFANKLGLKNPQEVEYLTIVAANRFTKDMLERTEANRAVVYDLGEKLLPRFMRGLTFRYSDKKLDRMSEAEKGLADFSEVVRATLVERIGESRLRTIELAMHEILTTGLVKGGKQGAIGNFKTPKVELSDEDIEQWSNRWKSKLETSAQQQPPTT